jgi:molybdopterin-binding protein
MSSIVAVNAKNQFRGTIKKLVPGSVVSEIVIETPAGTVSSVITTSSAKELELLPGVAVLALFKATEVSIAKLESKPTGDLA